MLTTPGKRTPERKRLICRAALIPFRPVGLRKGIPRHLPREIRSTGTTGRIPHVSADGFRSSRPQNFRLWGTPGTQVCQDLGGWTSLRVTGTRNREIPAGTMTDVRLRLTLTDFDCPIV